MKRTMSTAVAALLISQASLFAQQPMAPTPAAPGMVITSTLKASGAQYAGWLATAFDSIPAAKYGFRPTPQQLTVGFVAQHLEYANYLLCSTFGGLTHPTAAKDSLADTVKAMWPKDTLVARLKASFEFCDRAFAAVTDANLPDSIAVHPPFSATKIVRARAVLLYVTDLVDHYSQLANYMRINGLVPPSSHPKPK